MGDVSECTVLIVDDAEANIDILVNTLEDDYQLRVAMDGQAALESIEMNRPDIVLLDVMMPVMDGFEVIERLKMDPRTRSIPVIFLTALTDQQEEAKGLALGAVDFITKPFNPGLVKARVHNHLLLKRHQDDLEGLVAERTTQLGQTQDVIIRTMGVMVESRDPETGGHIQRTQGYIRTLAEQLQTLPKHAAILSPAIIELLYKSAPLHDIGKVAIPDAILLKPGKLTPEEFEVMKTHAVLGRDIIIQCEKELPYDSFLHYAREIASSHHEKWDGSGYPQGLAGEDIPLCGRIMAVADVYDALISKRVYKSPFSHSKAVAIIREGRGNHFDPEVVDAFFAMEAAIRQVALDHCDFDEERINLMQ